MFCSTCGGDIHESHSHKPDCPNRWPGKDVLVDPKVYELAEAFIEDSMPMPKDETRSEHAQRIVQELAAHIQRSIEDWIEYERQPNGLLS